MGHHERSIRGFDRVAIVINLSLEFFILEQVVYIKVKGFRHFNGLQLFYWIKDLYFN